METLVERLANEQRTLRGAAANETPADPGARLLGQHALLDAIDSSEHSGAIDLESANLGKLAADLFAGRPLEVYAVEPVAMQYARNDTEADPAECARTAVQIIGLLGRLCVYGQPLVATVVADRLMNGHTDKIHQNAVHYGIRQLGLGPERVDFREPSKPEGMIERLRLSRRGKLVYIGGSTSFVPHESLWEKADIQPVAVNAPGSILVQDRTGRYSETAVLAGGLHPSNAAKLVIADTFGKSTNILRGANVLNLAEMPVPAPPRHHSIRHDHNRLTPSTIAYALARLLATETQKYIEATANLRDSSREPGWAVDYLREQYGEGVLNENEWGILNDDLEILTHFTNELPRHIPPRSLSSYRNIGRGPYSYLDSLFEPFMAPGARMRLEEPSDEARWLIEGWKQGTLPQEFAAIGPKFEAFMVYAGTRGYLWRGSDERARKIADISDGSLQNLQGHHCVEGETFVSCSTARTLDQFQSSICKRAKASTEYVIGMHMLGKENWGNMAGNNNMAPKFPSVRLTEEAVLDTYSRVAGLDILSHITSSQVRNRPGYSGMIGVFARKLW